MLTNEWVDPRVVVLCYLASFWMVRINGQERVRYSSRIERGGEEGLPDSLKSKSSFIVLDIEVRSI